MHPIVLAGGRKSYSNRVSKSKILFGKQKSHLVHSEIIENHSGPVGLGRKSILSGADEILSVDQTPVCRCRVAAVFT